MKNGKDTNLIYDAIWFLDGVMEEFIQRAKDLEVLKMPFVMLQKEEHLDLGVLGWHTYLQDKGIPFEGLLAQFETRKIFSVKLKLKAKELLWILQRHMANLCGVLELVCAILIYVLLLPLLAIVSLVEMFRQV